MDKALGGTSFSNTYKHDCFLAWYKLGKPPATEFRLRMEVDEFDRRPSLPYLQKWMKGWRKQAELLDKEMELGIVEKQVAAKVEMLDRHAQTGKTIQGYALDWLEQNKDQLTPQSAVRLLQVGVEIERESVSIPEALKKMQKLDDESLLTEITAIISESDVTIEAIEAELDADNIS